MKKLLCLIIFFSTFLLAESTEIDYKYGKITQEEVAMKEYILDKDADAVILGETVSVYYLIDREIKLVTEVSRRIKVLKEGGKEYADITIPYTVRQDKKEYISGLDATTYNLENNKIVKTPLNKKFLFDEKISETKLRKKFSIPEVKIGSVFEYKYQIYSDFFWDLPSIYIQHSIPVKQSKVEVSIPEYFKFHINSRGYLPLNIIRSSGHGNIVSNPSMSFFTNEIGCVSENVPALPSESHVWCVEDFKSGIDFEISGVEMPGYYRYFSTNWKDVNKALSKSNFGDNLKLKNPYPQEVSKIKNGEGTDKNKISEILKLVQTKINWDGNRNFFTKKVSEAIKKGVGSSADKNFILAAALRDAGYITEPILLRSREDGRLPLTHASQDKLSTFILKVNLPDSSSVFLDAADSYSNYNVIPTELLVDRARTYDPNGTGNWINISSINKSIKNLFINCVINNGNELSGKIISTYSNQFAYDFSSKYAKFKSKEEYIEDYEKNEDLKIDSVSFQNLNSTRCAELITFKKSINSTDEIIYINSTIIPLIKENVFKDVNRKLPIEFPFVSNYIIASTIAIPLGYEIEEMPKDMRVTACNDALSVIIRTEKLGDKITVNVNFKCDQLIFPTTDFAAISSFFEQLAQISNSQVVFKKIAKQANL